MNLGVLAVAAKRAERLIASNSPVLLTAAGVTGVLTTAYFAAKASVQAHLIVKDEVFKRTAEAEPGERVPWPQFREKVELTWRCYIPTGLSAAMSIAAIIAANRISTNRAMAMASAYSLSEKALGEYMDRNKEKLGERKEQAFRDEIIQDKVNRIPNTEITIIDGGGDVLCYDDWSGRTFSSSMEKIKRAENLFNHMVIHDTYASLSDFYDLVGLDRTGESDNVGWNTDELLDLGFSSGHKDGVPYLAVIFKTRPEWRFNRSY